MNAEDILIKPDKIKESRKAALEQIKTYLNAPDIEGQFANRSGDYYSKDKFLVTWLGNYHGCPSEFRIDKVDDIYGSISGFKAIYAAVGLFHEKQIKGYGSIERALLEAGLMLCPNKKSKVEFFKKYAEPYNIRISKPADFSESNP